MSLLAREQRILGEIERELASSRPRVDVLTDSPSPWATAGCYHWVFEFPALVDPLFPCQGRPGLWVPPATIAARLAGVV